jgi:hypothetical protein
MACHSVAMTPKVELPSWPAGTVVILVTAGPRPHAIPVSAALRAADDRVLLGLARSRESLRRLREDPQVTLAVCAHGCAFSADGRATVVQERLTDRVSAVEVHVSEIHDHMRATFELQEGPRWRWTDPDAARADAEVRAALRHLVG